MEEFKQVDSRMIFYLGQANRITTAYFIGFVGFCAWLIKDGKQFEIHLLSALVSFGLLLGIVLLVINGRAVERLRAYKIVFFENGSEKLFYESTRLLRKRPFGRCRYYGILGIIIHIFAFALFVFDPVSVFKATTQIKHFLSLCLLLPGLIFSISILFRENDLRRYVKRYELAKEQLGNDKISEQLAAQGFGPKSGPHP